MTHEFKNILLAYKAAKTKGTSCVLATVVALDGSSYRRPGVRMLIDQNGIMTGAVSGGCVEKEVLHQATSVFKTGLPKMMTYDGRFRLGCEGLLYILIEPFKPSEKALQTITEALASRTPFDLCSQYMTDYGTALHLGSYVVYKNTEIPFHTNFTKSSKTRLFKQDIKATYKLIIIGAEHDSVKLSHLALGLGWEVVVASVPLDDKNQENFPGIHAFWNLEPEALPAHTIDAQTAIVLMTHSYAKDLRYLSVLKNSKPMYLGLLGPSKRREKLFSSYIEHYPNENYDFFDHIHGPAGLNIGAEAPEEIAIAILAEILTVIRKQDPVKLKDKKQGIHN